MLNFCYIFFIGSLFTHHIQKAIKSTTSSPLLKFICDFRRLTKEVHAHVTGRELKVLVAMIYNFAFTEGTLPVRPYVAYFGLIVFPASINLYPPIVIAFREKHFFFCKNFV